MPKTKIGVLIKYADSRIKAIQLCYLYTEYKNELVRIKYDHQHR